jgi:hypothetical protein
VFFDISLPLTHQTTGEATKVKACRATIFLFS